MHKHTSTFKNAFVIFIWSWYNFVNKARQELAHFIKKEARPQFIQVVKPGSKLRLYSVISAHYRTLPVWSLCGSSDHWVYLFHRRVWTSFILSITLKSVVTEKSLGLGAETWTVPETLRGFLVVRQMSCCFFYMDQTKSTGSHPRSMALILPSFKVHQLWCFRAGLWCISNTGAEKSWSEGLQRYTRFV